MALEAARRAAVQEAGPGKATVASAEAEGAHAEAAAAIAARIRAGS
jgi:hypothetical protein